MTSHLNCIDETVQMRGHNIWFYAELKKITPNYHPILALISKMALTRGHSIMFLLRNRKIISELSLKP